MSLSAKILTPLIILITLFAASTAYQTHVLSEITSRIAVTGDALSTLPLSLNATLREARSLERLLTRSARSGRASLDAQLERQLALISARIEEATARLAALNSPKGLQPLQGRARSLLVSYAKIEAEARLIERSGRPREEARRLSREVERWGVRVRMLSTVLQQLAQSERELRQRQEREVLLNAIGFMALITLIGLSVTLYLARLLAPLKQLKEGVERFESGRYEHRIQLRDRGALGQLAQALNRMGEAIEERDSQLESQQNDRLQQARLATVGRLTAQITHELRNPLSSIGLNADLLEEELTELQSALKALELGPREALSAQVSGALPLLREIAREIDRLRLITEDYLRFARLPRPELSAIDLNAQCLELVDFVRAEYSEAQVALQLDLDPQPQHALADVNHTRSALLNLLRNAREALETQGGGRVTLRVRSWGGEACVSVVDEGPGLSEEALERLFEPFFSTKPQGTGLGLAMVRQLMISQRGRVEIKNNQEGGASVSLFLPTDSSLDLVNSAQLPAN